MQCKLKHRLTGYLLTPYKAEKKEEGVHPYKSTSNYVSGTNSVWTFLSV